MADVSPEFVGAQLARLVDGQPQMIETLGDMKARPGRIERRLDLVET